jgi:transcriptional regulator with XRE-family HTH domain
MKRTGQGDEVDVRKLAARAGISRGVVGDLASGARSRVTYESAAAICAALGVDMPILFGTVGRSLTFVPEQSDEPSIAASA